MTSGALGRQLLREENVMLIRIDYRIRSTNAFHNLVFPFYITEGTGV